jgi:hypothetical protein
LAKEPANWHFSVVYIRNTRTHSGHISWYTRRRATSGVSFDTFRLKEW